MNLLLSQAIDFLTTPSQLLLSAGAIGVALTLTKRRRLGLGLATASILFVAVAGWTPAGMLALATLEDQYDVPVLTQAPTGIIMLGGATDIPISSAHNVLAFNDGGERLTTVAALARRYPEARIILAGGPGHIARHPFMTESSIARDVLVSLGTPAERIALEEHSRTTYENAVNTAALVHPQAGEYWLLVTSAFHMPRSAVTFQTAGFSIVPYPVDYRTTGATLPGSITKGMDCFDLAFHEWLGLLSYRLSGRAKTGDETESDGETVATFNRPPNGDRLRSVQISDRL